MRAQYEFAAGLSLTVEGDGATIGHFDREYGLTRVPSTTPAVVVVAFTRHPSEQLGSWVAGGHKSMRWWTELAAPDAAVLSARIDVAGWPRSFARTLVQGYFVEPLISVAATRVNSVLLPAAAFRDGSGAIVVLGRSGSGKTSLAMHGLAIGAALLGDDQVLIGPDRRCRPFPRRLRLYSDLRDRAPVAYRQLPARVVAQLATRRLVRLLSRGAIAPALAVPVTVYGRSGTLGPAPVQRIAILERATGPGEIRIGSATVAEAVDKALQLLREQREHLALAAGDSWRDSLREVERRESQLLGAAFAGASVERITVPSPLAGGAMAQLAEAVGLTGPPTTPADAPS